MFGSLLQSNGLKRTIGSAFALASVLAPKVPMIAPYADLLQQAAIFTGAVGAAHPLVLKIVGILKRVLGGSK